MGVEVIRRTLYGWYDARQKMLRISDLPPDAPVRPSRGFLSKEAAQSYATRKRARLLWIPELPSDLKLAS